MLKKVGLKYSNKVIAILFPLFTVQIQILIELQSIC